jgi:hypothetical protein
MSCMPLTLTDNCDAHAHLSSQKVTRQKLPKDWSKRVEVIKQKVTEALKDTPQSILASTAPPGASSTLDVDYQRAVQLRDSLAATCERNIFGSLTGPAAVWDKVVKAYENKCEGHLCYAVGLNN